MGKKSRVLVIAGSDSGGGAGIQADIKAIEMNGSYAATAITALTAQNTLGVHGVFAVEPAFIAQQITVVLQDIGADAIKVGMLHSEPVITAVCSALAAYPDIPLVLDPVMRAKGGASLITEQAQQALVTQLLGRALLVTPNIPEAEALTGIEGTDHRSKLDMGRALLAMGAQNVLLKGGHSPDRMMVDMLFLDDGRVVELPSGERIKTLHTHGTGCTLASAIAAGLAQQRPLIDCVKGAISYVRKAIETSPELGKGHGPVNHAHPLFP